MCLHPYFSLPVNRTVTVNSLMSAFHNLATNTIEKKKINSKMLLRIEQDIQAGIDLWHGEAYANVRFQ